MLHLFFDSDELVGEAFLHVSGLHGEDGLEGVLFAPEDLDFLLVVVEFIGDVFDLLLDVRGRVLRGFGVCL